MKQTLLRCACALAGLMIVVVCSSWASADQAKTGSIRVTYHRSQGNVDRTELTNRFYRQIQVRRYWTYGYYQPTLVYIRRGSGATGYYRVDRYNNPSYYDGGDAPLVDHTTGEVVHDPAEENQKHYPHHDFRLAGNTDLPRNMTPSMQRELETQRGWSLLLDGQPAEAGEAFQAAMQLGPHGANPQVGYALALAKSGDLSAGALAMRKAAAQDPQALNKFVPAEVAALMIVELYQQYDQFAQLSPEDMDIQLMLASLEIMMREHALAFERINQVMEQTHLDKSGRNLHLLLQMHFKQLEKQNAAGQTGDSDMNVQLETNFDDAMQQVEEDESEHQAIESPRPPVRMVPPLLRKPEQGSGVPPLLRR